VPNEVDLLREHGNLISFLYPAQNKDLIGKMGDRKMTAFGKFCLRIRSITSTFPRRYVQ
jgi:NAD(P) transhydrogenase